jgi:predicted nucleic acid-binding protein
MRTLFADTFYFLAVFSEEDLAHERAVRTASSFRGVQLLTTAWVLMEFADATCARTQRTAGAAFVRHLPQQPDLQIVPSSDELFEAGLSLYESRPDKNWSLTDCVSFVVMQQHGVSEALTGDRHFSQAGFLALLA